MNFINADKSVIPAFELSASNTSRIVIPENGSFSGFTYNVSAGLTATIAVTQDNPNSASARWVNVVTSKAGDDLSFSLSGTAGLGIRVTRVSGTGNVVLILATREPEATSPLDNRNGLIAYYEADQGVTLDGSLRVQQWDDLSGNGAHFTQATAGSRPLYSAVSFGGRPAIQLKAGTHFMSASPTISAGAPLHTIITIVRANNAPLANFNGIVAVGTGVAGGQSSTIGNDNLGRLWFGGSGLGDPVHDTVKSGAYYYLVKTTQNVASLGSDTPYVGTSKKPTYTQPGAYSISPANRLFLGQYIDVAAFGGNWDVSAIAVYNRILSDAEIFAIITYYQNKHGSAPNGSFVSNNLTLKGWYKADEVGSTADGTLVDSWSDSSGNANHVTATGALRPTFYKDTSAELLNGLPTIAFNGSNALTCATGFTGQPFTVFMVARITGASVNQYLFDGGSSNFTVIYRLSGFLRAYAGANVGPIAMSLGTWVIIVATFNGASSAIRMGNTEVTGNGGALTTSGITIGNIFGAGAGVGMTGNVAEVIVATGTYSSTIQNEVVSYLARKWAVTL